MIGKLNTTHWLKVLMPLLHLLSKLSNFVAVTNQVFAVWYDFESYPAPVWQSLLTTGVVAFSYL